MWSDKPSHRPYEHDLRRDNTSIPRCIPLERIALLQRGSYTLGQRLVDRIRRVKTIHPEVLVGRDTTFFIERIGLRGSTDTKVNVFRQ